MRAKWKEIWKDNSGFTLMELLIVIAISAILLGLISVTIAVVNNSNVNKAAHNYSSVISRARAESMAKGTAAGELTLRMENGILYYWLGSPDDIDVAKEEICGSLIGVEIVYSDSTSEVFADGAEVTISFSTSGFVERPGGARFVSQLIFSRGNRRVATVLYSTGKNETMLL